MSLPIHFFGCYINQERLQLQETTPNLSDLGQKRFISPSCHPSNVGALLRAPPHGASREGFPLPSAAADPEENRGEGVCAGLCSQFRGSSLEVAILPHSSHRTQSDSHSPLQGSGKYTLFLNAAEEISLLLSGLLYTDVCLRLFFPLSLSLSLPF